MADPAYRRRHEKSYPLFKLEVQILNAIEKKHWTYADLARALHTAKSNVSRDLCGGGIHHATVERVGRIADRLDMDFLPILVPHAKADALCSKIQHFLAA